MQHLSRQIDKLARTRWPVLILGETGTGKESVARAIYQGAANGSFVPIDCSTLLNTLSESELFGHVKGSFTGATVAKLGLFEKANGGTAFLDEIGELSLEMQAKLLRVLQEKELRPVGSTIAKRVDFRLISATNVDVVQEIERKRFRQDLFYRINVVTLRIPPLRDRKEDIPAMITHFLGRYGKSHVLTQETRDAMFSYDWPGNVRELENSIQHMVAMNSGPLIHIPDMPSYLQNHAFAKKAQYRSMAVSVHAIPGAQNGLAEPPVRAPGGTDGIVPLAALEKRAIIEGLQYTKGDCTAAAALLGIGRTTLYRRLKEYGLDVANAGN